MKLRDYIFTFLCFISKYRMTVTADHATLVAADHVQYLDYAFSGNSSGEICRWKLISAPMEVKVVETSLGDNCQFDNVTLYKGESTASEDNLKTWCGTDTSPYESVTENLTVVFYSAGGNPNTTFKLSYRKLYGPDGTMHLKPLHKKDGLEGSVIFLNCRATCYPDCEYSWQKDGRAIDFGNDTNHKDLAHVGDLHLHDVIRHDAGVYTCTAMNPSIMTTWNASLTVRVFYGPENTTSISRIPSTDPVEGEVYSLNCSANCFPACTYTWRFRGSVVQFDQPSGLLEIQNVSLSNSGLYTCTVINPETSKVGTRSTNIGLFHGPDDTTSVVKMSSSPAVEGHAYSLNCSAVCVPACKYSWSFGGSALQSDSSSGLLVINNVSRSDAGLYTCTAINNESMKSGTDSTSIDVLYGPNMNMFLISSKPAGEPEFGRMNLNCTAYCNPRCRYIWTHNGAGLHFRRDATVHHTLSTTNGDLHLHDMYREDAGTYSCTANNTATRMTWSKSITVVVFYGPDSTSIVKTPSTAAVEGQPYSLNCSAHCVPACRYTWSFRGSDLQSNKSSGLLIINNVRRSNAGLYTCTAINSVLMKERSFSTQIGLFYGPDNVTSIERIPSGDPVFGKKYSLNCSADCVPACRFSWTFGGVVVVTNSSSGLLVITNVTKNDDGHYTCTAVNEKTLDSATASVDVDVYYKPVIKKFDINAHSRSVDVKELDKVDMNCVVDSDPPSTIQLLNGTSQMKETSKSKEIHHSWPRAACEDTGDYFCTADDGISEPTKENVQLFVQCSPRLNDHTSFISHVSAKLGSDAILNISVIAYPKPVFSWYKLGDDQPLNSTHHVELNPWSALGQMVLRKTQIKDAGDYQVFVSNGVPRALVKKITLTVTDDIEEPGGTAIPAHGIITICVCVLGVLAITILVVLLLRRRAAANQVRKQSSGHGALEPEDSYDVINDDASSSISNPAYRGVKNNPALNIEIHQHGLETNDESKLTPDVEGPKQGFEMLNRESSIDSDGDALQEHMNRGYITAVDTYGHLRRCPVPPDQPFIEGDDIVKSGLEIEGPEQGYNIGSFSAGMTPGTEGHKQTHEIIDYDSSTRDVHTSDHGSASVKRDSSVNDTIKLFENRTEPLLHSGHMPWHMSTSV